MVILEDALPDISEAVMVNLGELPQVARHEGMLEAVFVVHVAERPRTLRLSDSVDAVGRRVFLAQPLWMAPFFTEEALYRAA